MENIILECFLNIGDRVVMNMDAESRGLGIKNVPNGTQGICVGFFRFKKFYGRNEYYNNYHNGEYEGNGACYIQWSTGVVERVSASDIAFVDQTLKQPRYDDSKRRNAYDVMIRVGDLPHTTIYEGAIITSNRDVKDSFIVTSISYDKIKEVRDDGSEYPIYNIKSINKGYSTYVNFSEVIEIIDKGNYYRLEKNEELIFQSLEEEIKFYVSIGKSEQLINKVTSSYGWDINGAIKAIKLGEADFMSTNNLFNMNRNYLHVYKFKDMPDLSKRCQEKVIAENLN